MVVGSGMIAKTFKEYRKSKEILIFASGVSNSLESDQEVFKREFDMVESSISSHPKKVFVYFSTCSIQDSFVNQRPYVKHKLRIEALIKEKASHYFIFRISNAIGVTSNNHTILNYLIEAIQTDKPVDIWSNSERNLIDITDVKIIVNYILNNFTPNKIINIAIRKNLNMLTILERVEVFLNKKAKATIKPVGVSFTINTTPIDNPLNRIEAEKGHGIDYLDHLLKKYY